MQQEPTLKMGKKRMQGNSDERIQRKIQKLQEKLNKRRDNLIVYSSEEDNYNNCNESNFEETLDISTFGTPDHMADNLLGHEPASPSAQPSPQMLEMSQPTTAEIEPVPSTSTAILEPRPIDITPTEEDLHLPEDVLQLLGEAPEPETVLGPAIHQEIASRWQDILKKGLSKETKEKLCKEYLIPGNCELLIPPILNEEAKAALVDQSTKRDSSLVYRQKHLGIALAALSRALQKIVINKDPAANNLKQACLRPISDACRLLCDMHNGETKIRRRFVISSTNSSLKDTLVNSASGKYLFGENMSEKVKAAQTVQKSGEALKQAQKTLLQQRGATNKNRPNYRTLHTRTAGRQDAGKPLQAPCFQQNMSLQSRRGRPRSPPVLPPPPPPRRPTRR